MSVVRTIDTSPPSYRFLAYQGDPIDVELQLSVDGQPADVDGWVWAAQIDTGGVMISWDCTGLPNGVGLYLRGIDTLRLPQRDSRFDVVGRHPDAGEGRTVLRGSIMAAKRITPPLREAALHD